MRRLLIPILAFVMLATAGPMSAASPTVGGVGVAQGRYCFGTTLADCFSGTYQGTRDVLVWLTATGTLAVDNESFVGSIPMAMSGRHSDFGGGWRLAPFSIKGVPLKKVSLKGTRVLANVTGDCSGTLKLGTTPVKLFLNCAARIGDKAIPDLTLTFHLFSTATAGRAVGGAIATVMGELDPCAPACPYDFAGYYFGLKI